MRGGKKDSHLIYMCSRLIIYFLLVVVSRQIFYFNSFKNSFWDFTHAVINNVFLVLMSNGWAVGQSNTSSGRVHKFFKTHLEHFWTFLQQPFLRILEHVTKVDKTVAIVTNYCHILLTVTQWLWSNTTLHTVRQPTQWDICFAIMLLGNLPSHPCLNICKMEYNP